MAACRGSTLLRRSGVLLTMAVLGPSAPAVAAPSPDPKPVSASVPRPDPAPAAAKTSSPVAVAPAPVQASPPAARSTATRTAPARVETRPRTIDPAARRARPATRTSRKAHVAASKPAPLRYVSRDGRLPRSAAAVLPFSAAEDAPLREAALGLLVLVLSSATLLGLTYQVWRGAP